MITENYVSFETAKLLKEKGFPQEYDIYSSMVYNEEDYEDEYEVQRMVVETKLVKAGTLFSYPVGVPEPKCYCPTLQMAMKWLREIHNFHIWVEPNHDKEGLYNAHVKVGWWSNNWGGVGYNTYEEACESAIKYCLKHLI